MTIEVGKSYRTRDGQRVRIIAVDRKGPYPVVGLVSDSVRDEVEVLSVFKADGRYSLLDSESHGKDLIEEVKPRHTRYIVALPDYGYENVEDARHAARMNPYNAAVVKITFEEGEGL